MGSFGKMVSIILSIVTERAFVVSGLRYLPSRADTFVCALKLQSSSLLLGASHWPISRRQETVSPPRSSQPQSNKCVCVCMCVCVCAPRDTHRDSRRERNSLLTLEVRTDSPDESGMQTRDPCRPWSATLDPGHKPRLGLFCPAVTLAQSPAPPRNPNGRLDFKANKRKPKFPVITRESRRNSSKTTWFSRHRKMRPLPATAFQKMSQVPS